MAVPGSLGYRRACSSAWVGGPGASEPATSFLGLIFFKGLEQSLIWDRAPRRPFASPGSALRLSAALLICLFAGYVPSARKSPSPSDSTVAGDRERDDGSWFPRAKYQDECKDGRRVSLQLRARTEQAVARGLQGRGQRPPSPPRAAWLQGPVPSFMVGNSTAYWGGSRRLNRRPHWCGSQGPVPTAAPGDKSKGGRGPGARGRPTLTRPCLVPQSLLPRPKLWGLPGRGGRPASDPVHTPMPTGTVRGPPPGTSGSCTTPSFLTPRASDRPGPPWRDFSAAGPACDGPTQPLNLRAQHPPPGPRQLPGRAACCSLHSGPGARRPVAVYTGRVGSLAPPYPPGSSGKLPRTRVTGGGGVLSDGSLGPVALTQVTPTARRPDAHSTRGARRSSVSPAVGNQGGAGAESAAVGVGGLRAWRGAPFVCEGGHQSDGCRPRPRGGGGQTLPVPTRRSDHP